MTVPLNDLEQEIRDLNWKRTQFVPQSLRLDFVGVPVQSRTGNRGAVAVAIASLVLGMIIGRTSVASQAVAQAESLPSVVQVAGDPSETQLIKTSFPGPDVAMLCSQVGQSMLKGDGSQNQCLACHKGMPEAEQLFHHQHKTVLPSTACSNCHVNASETALEHEGDGVAYRMHGMQHHRFGRKQPSAHGHQQNCRMCHVTQRARSVHRI